MGLNDVVSAERVHIAFFGRTNAGKSSLVNAVTNQDLSVVSSIKGTTTDPVRKAMEILPLGPTVIIDTPGFDDSGKLGELRINKTKKILDETDIAVLVVDAAMQLNNKDNELIELFKAKNIPYIIAYNKCDILANKKPLNENEILVSATKKINIVELREKLGNLNPKNKENRKIIGDLLNENDLIILVIPVDEAAPKGRLILPQQQTIRDILDSHAMCICCQDTELRATLNAVKQKPKMVITDSQVFEKISPIVPEDILLTSFSILFARYKGELNQLIEGASAIDKLNDGDTILISEGCTHHRQCNDIGSVKIPKWIKEFTKKQLNFEFTSGKEFPNELNKYKLIIHCGGCMLNETEMKSRQLKAKTQNVPMVNYGIAIAHMHGILNRSLQPFK